MRDRIKKTITEGINLRQQCSLTLVEPLLEATEILKNSLQASGKILICGNGGSAADAQHFAGELVNRFETNRPGLAAIALTNDASVITSIANDLSFEQVFARQVEALGNEGDVLLAISTSGDSPNILAAITAAAAARMKVIALTGRDGGALRKLESVDTHINIRHTSTPRVQEMHITCLHILCDLIDLNLFGGESCQ
ncbi:MAG: SIS domain-containing protein [Mariprofundaceae bacterium]